VSSPMDMVPPLNSDATQPILAQARQKNNHPVPAWDWLRISGTRNPGNALIFDTGPSLGYNGSR
jgi:hypothetical protein